MIYQLNKIFIKNNLLIVNLKEMYLNELKHYKRFQKNNL